MGLAGTIGSSHLTNPAGQTGKRWKGAKGEEPRDDGYKRATLSDRELLGIFDSWPGQRRKGGSTRTRQGASAGRHREQGDVR